VPSRRVVPLSAAIQDGNSSRGVVGDDVGLLLLAKAQTPQLDPTSQNALSLCTGPFVRPQVARAARLAWAV
jgi:hypothetical protein